MASKWLQGLFKSDSSARSAQDGSTAAADSASAEAESAAQQRGVTLASLLSSPMNAGSGNSAASASATGTTAAAVATLPGSPTATSSPFSASGVVMSGGASSGGGVRLDPRVMDLRVNRLRQLLQTYLDAGSQEALHECTAQLEQLCATSGFEMAKVGAPLLQRVITREVTALERMVREARTNATRSADPSATGLLQLLARPGGVPASGSSLFSSFASNSAANSSSGCGSGTGSTGLQSLRFMCAVLQWQGRQPFAGPATAAISAHLPSILSEMLVMATRLRDRNATVSTGGKTDLRSPQPPGFARVHSANTVTPLPLPGPTNGPLSPNDGAASTPASPIAPVDTLATASVVEDRCVSLLSSLCQRHLSAVEDLIAGDALAPLFLALPLLELAQSSRASLARILATVCKTPLLPSRRVLGHLTARKVVPALCAAFRTVGAGEAQTTSLPAAAPSDANQPPEAAAADPAASESSPIPSSLPLLSVPSPTQSPCPEPDAAASLPAQQAAAATSCARVLAVMLRESLKAGGLSSPLWGEFQSAGGISLLGGFARSNPHVLADSAGSYAFLERVAMFAFLGEEECRVEADLLPFDLPPPDAGLRAAALAAEAAEAATAAAVAAAVGISAQSPSDSPYSSRRTRSSASLSDGSGTVVTLSAMPPSASSSAAAAAAVACLSGVAATPAPSPAAPAMVSNVLRQPLRNQAVFELLRDLFLEVSSAAVRVAVLRVMDGLFRLPGNYLAVKRLSSVAIFLESLPHQPAPVQHALLHTLQRLVRSVDVVPFKELCALSSVLHEHARRMPFPLQESLLRAVASTLTFDPRRYRHILRESGVLDVLIELLAQMQARVAPMPNYTGSPESSASAAHESLLSPTASASVLSRTETLRLLSSTLLLLRDLVAVPPEHLHPPSAESVAGGAARPGSGVSPPQHSPGSSGATSHAVANMHVFAHSNAPLSVLACTVCPATAPAARALIRAIQAAQYSPVGSLLFPSDLLSSAFASTGRLSVDGLGGEHAEAARAAKAKTATGVAAASSSASQQDDAACGPGVDPDACSKSGRRTRRRRSCPLVGGPSLSQANDTYFTFGLLQLLHGQGLNEALFRKHKLSKHARASAAAAAAASSAASGQPARKNTGGGGADSFPPMAPASLVPSCRGFMLRTPSQIHSCVLALQGLGEMLQHQQHAQSSRAQNTFARLGGVPAVMACMRALKPRRLFEHMARHRGGGPGPDAAAQEQPVLLCMLLVQECMLVLTAAVRRHAGNALALERAGGLKALRSTWTRLGMLDRPKRRAGPPLCASAAAPPAAVAADVAAAADAVPAGESPPTAVSTAATSPTPSFAPAAAPFSLASDPSTGEMLCMWLWWLAIEHVPRRPAQEQQAGHEQEEVPSLAEAMEEGKEEEEEDEEEEAEPLISIAAVPPSPSSGSGFSANDSQHEQHRCTSFLPALSRFPDLDFQHVHRPGAVSFLARLLPGCSAAFQKRVVTHLLHSVVASTLTARALAAEGDADADARPNRELSDGPVGGVLLNLIRAYKALLVRPCNSTEEEQDSLRETLLQLLKCLLPYVRSANGVHEVLKLLEGIDMDDNDEDDTDAAAVGSPTPSNLGSARATSCPRARPWPQALCGMLVDACASGPAIPYLLFDGDSPASMEVPGLSGAVWPPGLCSPGAHAGSGAAAAAAAAASSSSAAAAGVNPASVGYSFAAWVYMEPVVDAQSLLGSGHRSPSASFRARSRARASAASSWPASSPPSPSLPLLKQASAEFCLLHVSGEDGRLSFELTYHADSGALMLRVGGGPGTGDAAIAEHEFQHVGLIPHRWCHLALAHSRDDSGAGGGGAAGGAAFERPVAHLYVDGVHMASAPIEYLPRAAVPAAATSSAIAAVTGSSVGAGFRAWMGSAPPPSIGSSSTNSGHDGAGAMEVHGLRWRWRVASLMLLDEVLSDESVAALYDAGPRVSGLLGPSVLPTVAPLQGESLSSSSSGCAGGHAPGCEHFLVTDVAAGCYDLPSACAEALDAVALAACKQRKAGGFASVGAMGVSPPSPSSTMWPLYTSRAGGGGGSVTSPISSPSHDHLLAPAASTEQEQLTQTELTPLEADSITLGALVPQERILFSFHARHACAIQSDSTFDGVAQARSHAQAAPDHAELLAALNLTGLLGHSSPSPRARAHTRIFNTGGAVAASAATGTVCCGDALLYGIKCAPVQPTPPQDMLRGVGGVKRLLLLIEHCCTPPAHESKHGSAASAAAAHTLHSNPASSLRQALLLLLVCLRRNPKNFREMHACNGYAHLALLLKRAAGRKFKVRVEVPVATSVPPQGEAPVTTSSLPPLLVSPPSACGATVTQTLLLPVLDHSTVSLVFALVGLRDRGMGGYIANTAALDLLLDHRLWERCGLPVLLELFRGIINSCVGNPDRVANITALREARLVPWMLVILTNTKTFERTHHHHHQQHQQHQHNSQTTGSSSNRGRSGSVSSPAANAATATSEDLLNSIMTLLRVLLMSELIDQELHLLANFAMTRTVGLAAAVAVASRSQQQQQQSILSPGVGAASSWSPLSTASARVSSTPGSVTRSLAAARLVQRSFLEMLLDVLLKIHAPAARATSDDRTAAPAPLQLGGSGIASAAGPQPSRAMQIFTRSVSFVWIFAVLKDNDTVGLGLDPSLPGLGPGAGAFAAEERGRVPGAGPIPTPAHRRDGSTPASSSTSTSAAPSALAHLEYSRDPDCAVLALKMLLVMLESPQMLAEFRSSSVQAESSGLPFIPLHKYAAAGAGAGVGDPSDATSPSSSAAATAQRVVSFASLGQLLLPYATCSQVYPVLLCIMLGRGVHDLATMPSHLGAETVDAIFQAMLPQQQHRQQLHLVVPEIVDILVDMLSKNLQLLSAAQGRLYAADPLGFLAASAAVASFVAPTAHQTRVYKDVHETGVLGPAAALTRGALTAAQRKKLALALAARQARCPEPFCAGLPPNPNRAHEDTLLGAPELEAELAMHRGPVVADIVGQLDGSGLTCTSAHAHPLQRLRDPAPLATAASSPLAQSQSPQRPHPLSTTTPTHAPTPDVLGSFTFTTAGIGGSSIPSAVGQHAAAAAAAAADSSPTGAAASPTGVPALPSLSLLNGIVLFLMRLLHVNEDFGRVVSRSTFLRPLVAAVFTSAHLNPIVTGMLGQEQGQRRGQHHAHVRAPSSAPQRAASVLAMRGTGVHVGRFSHVPLPPAAGKQHRSQSSVDARPVLGAAEGATAGSPQGRGVPASPAVIHSPQREDGAHPLPSPGPGLFSPSQLHSPPGLLSPQSLGSPNSYTSAQFSPSPGGSDGAAGIRSPDSLGVRSISDVLSPAGLSQRDGGSGGGGGGAGLFMDLRSPASGASIHSPLFEHAHDSPAALPLGSPAHVALQHQQLALLAAPPSPRAGADRVRKTVTFDESAAAFLNLGPAAEPTSTSHPLGARHHSFHSPSSAGADAGAGWGPSPSPPATTTSSVFEAAFTFTPMPEGLDAAQLPSYLAASPLAVSVPSPVGASPSPAAAAGAAVTSFPFGPHSHANSLRTPLFRHSTSQLLLRFLRQVLVYNLSYKKDGWLIVDKVLDAVPSDQEVEASMRARPISQAQAHDSKTAAAAATEEKERRRQLIASFHSAVLSILLIRLQEKLSERNSDGTAHRGLLVTNSGGHAPAAAAPSPGGAITAVAPGGSSSSSGGLGGPLPSKLLANIAGALESILAKIHCGLFSSRNWSMADLLGAGADADAPGSESTGGTTPTASQSGNSSSGNSIGSTVGLVVLLMSLLQHPELRPHIDGLNAATTSLLARSSRRKTSTLSTGTIALGSLVTVVAGGSSAAGGGTGSSSSSNGVTASLSASAALTAPPLNRCLRSLMDALLNSVLSLYEAHSLGQVSAADLLHLNRFVLRQRALLLGDYAVAAHVSHYLSAQNSACVGAFVAPSTATSIAPAPSPTAAPAPLQIVFTGRSFVACIFYHLFYFQLRVDDDEEEEDARSSKDENENAATRVVPVDGPVADLAAVSGAEDSMIQLQPFRAEPSPSKPAALLSPRSVVAASTPELRHSALAILVWLARSKSALMAELMRASVGGGSLGLGAGDDASFAPLTRATLHASSSSGEAFPSSSIPGFGSASSSASHAVSYDLWNKGFDALLRGFNTLLSSSSSPSSPVGGAGSSSAGGGAGSNAEAEGFFSWLSIQRPILDLVLSRTLLPEWGSYLSYLAALPPTAGAALAAKWRRARMREAENAAIDTEEHGQMRSYLTALVADSTQVDCQRYLRRMQSLLENDRLLSGIWSRSVRARWRRTRLLYSKTRALHPRVPSRRELRSQEQKEAALARRRRRAERVASTKAQHDATGSRSSSSSCSSTSSSDSDEDEWNRGEELLNPGSFRLAQRWSLHASEGPSRTRPRLVRSALLRPGEELFPYAYRREAEEVLEARKSREAFLARRRAQKQDAAAVATAAAAAAAVEARGDSASASERPESDTTSATVAGGESAQHSVSFAIATTADHSASSGGDGASTPFVRELSTSLTVAVTPSASSTRALGGGGTSPADSTRSDSVGSATAPPNLQLTIFSPHGVGDSAGEEAHAGVDSDLLGGDGEAVALAPVPSPSGNSGKLIPESSERPLSATHGHSHLRRTPGALLASTPLSISTAAAVAAGQSLSLSVPGALSVSTPGPNLELPSTRRRGSFGTLPHAHAQAFAASGGSGGSQRNLLKSPRRGSAAGSSSSPRVSPRSTPVEGRSPRNSAAHADSGAAHTPHSPASAAASPTDTGITTAAAPSAAATPVAPSVEISSPGTAGSEPVRSPPALALPCPPQLQVDTPGGQHVRAPNASFDSPLQVGSVESGPATLVSLQVASSIPSAVRFGSGIGGDDNVHAAASRSPEQLDLGSVASSSSVALSPCGSAGGSPTELGAEEDGGSLADNSANSYYLSLLTEDSASSSSWLYSEHLRLLLDSEVITYHYNCLRIEGLEEVPAVFLLCNQSFFVVDQYQVDAEGAIVRLQGEATNAGGNAPLTAAAATVDAECGDDDSDDEGASGVSGSDGGCSSSSSASSRRWSYADVVAVHKRRYLLRPAALELFFADHTSHLLVVNIKQRDTIHKHLLQLCPNILPEDGAAATAGGGGGTMTPGSALALAASADALAANNSMIGGVGGGREQSASGASGNAGPGGAGMLGAGTGAGSGAGLAVGVGEFDVADSSADSSSSSNPSVGARLSTNLSSIFFTSNHTLGTEHSLGMVSAAIGAVLSSFTSEWQHGLVSNFDYLSLLNTLSGRTYNDLTQYPVMPWVLQEYDADELDLHSTHSFRDLSKPMGALDEQRAKMHRQKYRETDALWRDEEREMSSRSSHGGGGHGHGHGGSNNSGPMLMHGSGAGGGSSLSSRAYNYSTHYSSAAVTMYYLLRVAPFTQCLIHFQSGRFDRADRLFSSVKQTWLTASKLMSGDVKELIPEFYYFAPMLRNGNRLDLGRRQDGRPVDDVLLPPWAHGSAREFVRLHRLALESDWVSAHLHSWIDLIFGFKQSGEAAVSACNVFHYATYAGGVDIDRIADPLLRRGTAEMIRSFGQTPPRLFAKAHPSKIVATRAGRMWTDARDMEATDMAQFPHAIAQIFCVDSTMMLAGPGASSGAAAAVAAAAAAGHGSLAAPERLLVLRPGQCLSVPALQPSSSFLPYSLHDSSLASSRNYRASKSYRHSAALNKLSMISWGMTDGSVRSGMLDLAAGGSFSGGTAVGAGVGGCLDRAQSASVPSGSGGPVLRSPRCYLNMHDGVVRVAAVPLEGDDGTLVTGGEDCVVCVWRKADGLASLSVSTAGAELDYQLLGELHGHRQAITCLAVSRGHSLIASGSADASVILWDLVRLRPLHQLHYAPFGARISAVCINPATGDVVFASTGPTALMLADTNGTLLARYPDPRVTDPEIVAAGMTNGEGGATAALVPQALLMDQQLDAITSLCVAPSIGHRDATAARGLALGGNDSGSDSAALIVTGHRSGFIRIWNLKFLSFPQLFALVTAQHSAHRRHGGGGGGGGGSGSRLGSRSHSPERVVAATAAPQHPLSDHSSAPPLTNESAAVVCASASQLPPLDPPLAVGAAAVVRANSVDSDSVADAAAAAAVTNPALDAGAANAAESQSDSPAPLVSATSEQDASSSPPPAESLSPTPSPDAAGISPNAAAPLDTLALPSPAVLDIEVGAVNAAAAAATAGASPSEITAAASPVSPDAASSAVAVAQAQAQARSMSSLVYGSPGTEQIDDDYFVNGAAARAKGAAVLAAATAAPSAPSSDASGELVAPPLVHRQWHLVSVAELLGHQVPVTALALQRDGSALFSGDANGNVLHFTVAGASSALAVCGCKQSRNRSGVKLFHSLAFGGAGSWTGSGAPALRRIRCEHDGCAHTACDLCYLDHVRAQHPHPTADVGDAIAATATAGPAPPHPFTTRGNSAQRRT